MAVDTCITASSHRRFFPPRSTHHQAVADAAPEYRVVARADDGVIEAIEHPDEAFVLGVQWHPEMASMQPDWLLESFVRHCMPGEPD